MLTKMTSILPLCGFVFLLVSNACTAERTCGAPSATEKALDYFHTVSNPLVPPVPNNESSPLVVTNNVVLISIRDIDVTRDEMEITAYQMVWFQNPALAWQKWFPEVENLKVPPSEVWLPDVEPFNGVDTPTRTMIKEAKAFIANTGNVYHVPALNFRFTCNVQAVFSPEGANCTLVMGSWTYNADELDLQPEGTKMDTSNLLSNTRYEILDTFIERRDKFYSCCPVPFTTIHYTINVRAGPEYKRAHEHDKHYSSSAHAYEEEENHDTKNSTKTWEKETANGNSTTDGY